MKGMAKRHILKIFFLAALIFALSFSAICALGPIALKNLIVYKMQAAGIKNPCLTVVSVSHKGIDLKDVSIADPEISIDLIHVGYTLSSLLKGRVKDIAIRGLNCRIDLNPNASDKKTPLLPESGRDKDAYLTGISDLFFDQIDISSSVLQICTKNACHYIHADAHFSAKNKNLVEFKANAMAYGLPAEISGQADLNSLKSTGEIRAFSSAFTAGWSFDLSPESSSTAEMIVVAKNFEFSLSGHQTGFKKIRFKSGVNFDSQWSCTDAWANLDIDDLYLDKMQFDFINFSTEDRVAGIDLRAGLSKPFKARLNIRGSQSDIFQIIKHHKWETNLDWEVSAAMDSAADSNLFPFDVMIKPPLDFKAHGKLNAGFRKSGSAPGSKPLPKPWFFYINGGCAEIDPVNVFIPDYFAEIQGLDFAALFNVSGGPDGWKLRVFEKTGISANRIISKNSENPIEVKYLSLKAVDNQDFLSADLSGKGHISANLAIGLKHPLECIFPKGTLKTKNVFLKGNFKKKDSQTYSGSLDVKGKIEEILMPLYDLKIRDMEMEIPFVLNDPGHRSGWFSIPTIGYGDISLPAVDAKALVRLETSPGIIDFMLKPELELSVKDGRIDSKNNGLLADKINGSVVIKQLFPLTTPGNQRIDVGRLKLGTLELEDGFAAFFIEPRGLFLEKTRWKLPGGGFIAAHSSRIGFDPPGADFDVFFEHVDLIDTVCRLSNGKIVGSGRVYGRVPVKWSPKQIDIGKGYLYSLPGTGRFGIKDEKWLDALMLYVLQSMAGHKYLSLVSDRLEQALGDFEYDFLSVDIEPENEDVSARIELRGQGLRGEFPQQVGSLVINVNSIEEILNRVLNFYQTKQQSIKSALDTLFE
jgi:hypothetical protein